MILNKGKITLALLFIAFNFALAQKKTISQSPKELEKPKLVVGVVVDQMRYEYLTRFYSKYGQNGFKRLMREGYNIQNGHFNYIPTYTGPGHASVYTGTTPAVHGIIGNDFFLRKLNKEVYCVTDTTEQTVGSSSNQGQVSPRNLLTTTITDELKLFTGGRSKVVAVALKDRSSALPAGHLANGAYWYDRQTGNFITSTFYMKQLPQWVEDFNKRKLADDYLNRTWNTLLPLSAYTESGPDDTPYEDAFKGKDKPTFPYNLAELRQANKNYDLLPSVAFGNDITADIAKAAIEGEKLGSGEFTDFLAVSFSSPDYIGHRFGPRSVEIEDCYIRLDLIIADFLSYLDQKVGKGNYLMFLTADHAVAEVPQFLIDNKAPAGYITQKDLEKNLNDHLKSIYTADNLLLYIGNSQVYFNYEALRAHKIRVDEIQEEALSFLLTQPGIAGCYTGQDMRRTDYVNGLPSLLQNGYNSTRSGDLLLVFEPGWFESTYKTGTTHGTGYIYDTHVPMIFYGWNIPAGKTVKYRPITDMAATIAALLNMKAPDGATGKPIEEIFEPAK